MLKLSNCRFAITLFSVLLLTLATTPFVASAAAQAASAPAQRPSPAVSGSVPRGGWIAYRLAYPGDSAKVEVLLTYDPSDDPNDRGLVDGKQVTLAVYGPSAPPPAGKPIGWAEGNGGQKRYRLEATLGGDYVVIVNNWDSLGRRVEFGLNVAREGADGASGTGSGGDALTFVSASEGASETHRAEAGADEGDGDVSPAQGTAQGANQAVQTNADPSVRRVGIQAGHWDSPALPDELARLRTSTGTSGGGVPEWKLNFDVAQRVASLLEAEGVKVDVIPATVPAGYSANAFVALHADGDLTGRFSGYKLAYGRWSGTPVADQALLDAIATEYQAATHLPVDPRVSRNMTGYYAFSNRRFEHAVAPGTPAVILEMGFMTNNSDLQLLLGDPDTVAGGIARGILRYLEQMGKQ